MTGSGFEASDPLDELARENEVIQRLDERLGELAISLGSGTEIAAGEVAEGLRLYEQYVNVHARRFDGGLQPEARPVAMSTCFEHLDVISRDRAGLEERISRARQALEAYTHGDDVGRRQLVKELEAFTQHEYDQVRYENDYPLSCLRATLPDDAAQRVRGCFDLTGDEIADLDRHVDDYLHYAPGKVSARFRVHCARPGCPQKAEAESYPSENGHLGIRGPVGWKVSSHPPRTSRGGNGHVAVDIDFWCPDHLATTAGTAEMAAEIGAVPGRPSVQDSVPSGRSTGSCCEPIPTSSA